MKLVLTINRRRLLVATYDSIAGWSFQVRFLQSSFKKFKLHVESKLLESSTRCTQAYLTSQFDENSTLFVVLD